MEGNAMTVKQQTTFELVVVGAGVGCIVAVVVAALAAMFGRPDLAHEAGLVAGGCFLVFALGCFAAWAQTQEPLVECSECHRLHEPDQVSYIDHSDKQMCVRCLYPTKWVA